MMLIRHSILSCPLPRGQWATALEAPAPLPMLFDVSYTISSSYISSSSDPLPKCQWCVVYGSILSNPPPSDCTAYIVLCRVTCCPINQSDCRTAVYKIRG